MQNYFNLDTAVAHRRWDLERPLAAKEQRTQAHPQHGRPGWSPLALRILASLRALATPRVPVACWTGAGMKCAKTMAKGGATVA